MSGYGIFATQPLAVNDVVFRGEGRAHRLITKRYADAQWHGDAARAFRRYAYPLSSEVYALWDETPSEWSPQNHSCSANTTYDGLNVVATRRIAVGEELTLDYAPLMNEHSEPFQCACGVDGCRGTIRGQPGNSVTAREALHHAPAAPA